MPVIGVLSGKGGVGKTTVTSNLAAALSKEYGRNVVILDTNVYSSHIKLHFGVYEEVPFTLPDVVKKEKIDKFVYAHGPTNVEIIPSAATVKDVNFKKLKDIVHKLAKSKYHYVIIDCAPGFGKDVVTAIKAVDELIVVTTPQIPDVDDALKIIELLGMMEKKVNGIVINRVSGAKYELKMEQLEQTFDAPILAVVPESKKIPESIAAGVPLIIYAKYSDAAVEIKKLAAKIAGEEYKPTDPWQRFKDFLIGERFEFKQRPEEFLSQITEQTTE